MQLLKSPPKSPPPRISPNEAEMTNYTKLTIYPPPDYPPPKYYKNAYGLRIYNILQKIKIQYPELSYKIDIFDDYNKRKNIFNILQLCISKEELEIIFDRTQYGRLDNIYRDNLVILYNDIANRLFDAVYQRNTLIDEDICNVLYKIITKIQYITSLFEIYIETDYIRVLHILFLIYKTPSMPYKTR